MNKTNELISLVDVWHSNGYKNSNENKKQLQIR